MRILLTNEVKKRIDNAGYTAFSFAQKHGIVYESLRRWLNGQRTPKTANIQQLANALGCRVDQISMFAIQYNSSFGEAVESELNEIRDVWGWLTAEERAQMLSLIKMMAQRNIDINQKETDCIVEEVKKHI